MPYATNDGVRIHYHLAGNEAGPPLVLQHYFLGCLRDWEEHGYADALGKDYRLILIDARGHGLSDKPHDPEAYRFALHAGDVVAVLDQLGIARAHYCGYSLGGRTGYALSMHAPERCWSLIIGGDAAGEPDPNSPARRWMIDLLGRGPAAWSAVMPVQWTPAARERMMGSDAETLIASLVLIEQRGIAAALPRINVPCLIYCGDADPEHDGARSAAARMPQARFVSLQGCNHLDGIFRPDLALPHITAFLASVA